MSEYSKEEKKNWMTKDGYDLSMCDNCGDYVLDDDLDTSFQGKCCKESENNNE